MNQQNIEEDILGKGFRNKRIKLNDDKDGEQYATLVYRKSEQQSTKAILYVHGFIDYFFQTELADNFNKWGYNFYAVDLRKYGRSLLVIFINILKNLTEVLKL